MLAVDNWLCSVLLSLERVGGRYFRWTQQEVNRLRNFVDEGGLSAVVFVFLMAQTLFILAIVYVIHFSASFCILFCIFLYIILHFLCTVHCALDLARDHALQKCPLLIRASHSSPFRVLFSEEKGFTKGGLKVGVISQDGLSSGWSGMRVVFHLGGLHLVFQIVRWGCRGQVLYLGGLSPEVPL